MKLKFITAISALLISGSAFSQLTYMPPSAGANIMPSNWAEMQRHAAIERSYFRSNAHAPSRYTQSSNSDAIAGLAIIGIGLGIWANHQAEERRQLAIREYEMEMEARERRITSSPIATVQRTHIPQCITRVVADEHGRLFREKVCL